MKLLFMILIVICVAITIIKFLVVALALISYILDHIFKLNMVNKSEVIKDINKYLSAFIIDGVITLFMYTLYKYLF